MATEKKLDCVILGLLAHEDLTGYEIKKRMDTTLHYFWSASYGSIYPTLKELLSQDFVDVREETKQGRKKQIYHMTNLGSNYLKEWLSKPVLKDELRYETLLKLFFGKEVGKEQTLQHITAFQQHIQSELPYLYMAKKTLTSYISEDETHRYYLLTVEFGIQSYEAYLRWCKTACNVLKEVN